MPAQDLMHGPSPTHLVWYHVLPVFLTTQFLCAFVVGMPLATTQKANEARKIKELFLEVQTETSPTTEELEALSNRAIDFILYQASIEPENRRILNISSKSKKSIVHLLSRLESMLNLDRLF